MNMVVAIISRTEGGRFSDECVFTLYCLLFGYSLSSPYLCVFDNDRVTCYTRTNNVSGGAGEA